MSKLASATMSLMALAFTLLVALVGVDAVESEPQEMDIVASASTSSIITLNMHEGRVRDTGDAVHRMNLWWKWKIPLNQPRYYQWAKFSTWMQHYNLDGRSIGCGFWHEYKGTSVRLYVWSTSNGRNFSMKGYLKCAEDTTRSFVKGMDHTPRMYFKAGEIRYKVTGTDHYGWGKADVHWQVSGRLVRPEM